MAAYFAIMANLYQVIYLYATMNYSCSHDGSVHTTIGTYLHIILDNGDAYLRYLLITFLGRLKAKTIGTYDTASMQDTAIAYLTIVIDNSVAVYLCIRSDLCVPAYRDVRMQDAAIAYLHAFSYSNERPYVALLAYLCGWVNEGKVADAFTLGLHAFIDLKKLSDSLTSIRHLDERCLYLLLRFEVIIDEHDATLCLVNVSLVLVIIQEADAAWPSLFYPGEVVDLGFGIAYDGAPYQPCYHLCRKFHDFRCN